MISDISSDNPIHKLEAFFPLPDPSLDYLENYKRDLIYHYERGFFNLALFSFHYLYMTLLYIYLLKYHRFELENINACLLKPNKNGILAKNKKIKDPQKIFSYNFYSQNYKESEIIACFNTGDNKLLEQHTDLVRGRNEIAHASGVLWDEVPFNAHISSAIGILERVKACALDKLSKYPKNNFAVHIGEIYAEEHPSEWTDKIVQWIQEFYISEKDWEYLTATNIIDFGNWQNFKDMME